MELEVELGDVVEEVADAREALELGRLEHALLRDVEAHDGAAALGAEDLVGGHGVVVDVRLRARVHVAVREEGTAQHVQRLDSFWDGRIQAEGLTHVREIAQR